MPGSIYTYMIRLLAALLVGGLVGLERELHGKPAGLRTNILMSIGSCIFMIISIEVAREGGVAADPGRIAAQVVTGVGFLCAGTIIRSRFSVSGLTTAATLWVLSALGLAIGAGYIFLSAIGAVLITATLIGIRYIESALARLHFTHVIQLVMENRKGIVGSIAMEMSKLGIKSEIRDVTLSGDYRTATVEYDTTGKRHSLLLKAISDLEGIESVTEMV